MDMFPWCRTVTIALIEAVIAQNTPLGAKPEATRVRLKINKETLFANNTV